MPMRKPSVGVSGLPGCSESAPPGQLLAGWPAILEFLTGSLWDDGSSRVPGTLRLFVEDGRWKVCLSEDAVGRFAFLSGCTPEDVLTAADTALSRDQVEWRRTRPEWRKGKKP